jgi:predicted DNA-binding protein (MmcQ/YjbR family)
MNLESLRKHCKQLPHVTEDVKWGNDLCFLIGGKMFAVTCLDNTNPVKLAFKCTPESFAELLEVEGIIPAPYMARNHWVALERWDALRDAELKQLVSTGYGLVRSKLPKKVQAELATPEKKKATRR